MMHSCKYSLIRLLECTLLLNIYLGGTQSMNKRLIKISKFLSLVLRHKPEIVGLQLDEGGWVEIENLLNACDTYGKPLNEKDLIEVVEKNDKQRFLIKDGRIRANQGHSLEVDLQLERFDPPQWLYHGTASQFMNSISTDGLNKMKRQYVHLSEDIETARRVGIRYGKPVILRVSAAQMNLEGYKFYLSSNGVWLTNHVPSQFFEELSVVT